MATIGRLAVLIDADNSGLKAGLKEATRETEASSKAIISNVKAIAGAFSAYLSVDFFASTIKGAAEAGRQIDQLSRLSATSTAVFQQQAYAAQQFGISQQKLGDIFKDVQDKIGDFMQTGAGPMADFFEQIAPRVGVTADQFRRLGGPEALQLYVSSLEKANLSQSEMTFYMEALASDSALLLPLLRNNGTEMRRLGDEAERVGAVLNDQTIKANRDFAAQLDKLSAAATALKVNIGSALIPEITRLINEFNAGTKAAGGFWQALSLATINPFKNGAENIQTLRDRLKGLQDDRQRYLRANSDTSGIDAAIRDTEVKIKYLEEVMRKSWNLSGERMGMNDPRVIGAPDPRDVAGYTPPFQKAEKDAKPGKEYVSIFAEGDPVEKMLRERAERIRASEEDAEEARYTAWVEGLNKRAEALRQSVKTEEQITLARHESDRIALEDAYTLGILTQQEFMLMEQDLAMRHMEELARIRGDGEKRITDITKMNWAERAEFIVGQMAAMTQGIATQSKAAFNINKAAAIAQTIMDTQAGAARALKDYPAPWSYAVAGATYAQGIARVNAIKSQQFGGSGGMGAGGSAAVAPSQSAAATNGAGGGAQTITIQGVNSGDLFSGDAVRTLIDRLIDAQRNGAKIVLS